MTNLGLTSWEIKGKRKRHNRQVKTKPPDVSRHQLEEIRNLEDRFPRDILRVNGITEHKNYGCKIQCLEDIDVYVDFSKATMAIGKENWEKVKALKQ